LENIYRRNRTDVRGVNREKRNAGETTELTKNKARRNKEANVEGNVQKRRENNFLLCKIYILQ
jgi:hypothetical protein